MCESGQGILKTWQLRVSFPRSVVVSFLISSPFLFSSVSVSVCIVSICSFWFFSSHFLCHFFFLHFFSFQLSDLVYILLVWPPSLSWLLGRRMPPPWWRHRLSAPDGHKTASCPGRHPATGRSRQEGSNENYENQAQKSTETWGWWKVLPIYVVHGI